MPWVAGGRQQGGKESCCLEEQQSNSKEKHVNLKMPQKAEKVHNFFDPPSPRMLPSSVPVQYQSS